MSLRRIVKKSIVQEIYVSADNRETPIMQMDHTHLVNAFGKACEEENHDVIGVLKREILRRIMRETP